MKLIMSQKQHVILHHRGALAFKATGIEDVIEHGI